MNTIKFHKEKSLYSKLCKRTLLIDNKTIHNLDKTNQIELPKGKYRMIMKCSSIFESNMLELDLQDNEVVDIDVKGSIAGKYGKIVSNAVMLILPLYLYARFAELDFLFYTEIALSITGFLLFTLPGFVSVFASKPKERYCLKRKVLNTK